MDLLISVRSAQEAEAMLSAADWIDLKEPGAGALGALHPETARQACNVIGCRLPISAAAGELLQWPNATCQQLVKIAAIEVFKLGLARCAETGDWERRWLNAHQELREQKRHLAAVIYADYRQAVAPPPEAVVDLAESADAKFLLIDTYDKSQGGLFGHMTEQQLQRVFGRAQAAGMTTVAAGKLRQSDIPRLPASVINMVAVRGAVCPAGRQDVACPDLALALRATLTRFEACGSDESAKSP